MTEQPFSQPASGQWLKPKDIPSHLLLITKVHDTQMAYDQMSAREKLVAVLGRRAEEADLMSRPEFSQPAAQPDGTELGPDTAALLDQHRKLTAEIAQLAEARDEIRDWIEKMLGDSETGLVDGRPAVTWRWDKPSTVTDTARLKSEQPEIWAAYQKPRKPSRPFKILDPPRNQP